MKVSEILLELDIELEIIQEYLTLINYTFYSLDQYISDEIYNKIVAIHNNDGLKQRLINRKKANKPLIYIDKDSYRFKAKVKWYYNQQNKGEYGFLEIKNIGDIHFSGKVFMYGDPKNLIPGDEVVVTLNKKEFDNKRNNIKATSVNLISDEKDLDYLLFYFVNHFYDQNSNLEIVTNRISALKEKLNIDQIKLIESFISEKIKLQDLDFDKFKFIYILQKSCNININNLLDFTLLSPDKIFNFWLIIDELEFDFQLIKESLTNYIKLNLRNSKKILYRISESDRKAILNQIFIEKCTIYDGLNYELLVLIIDLFKSYEIPINYNIIQEDLLLRLWENKVITHLPFEPIYNKLIILKDKYYNANSLDEKLKISSSTFEFLRKVSSDDLKNILAKTHYEQDLINNKDHFHTIIFFIDHISEMETRNEYITEIFNKADCYYKLKLFVLDYTDEVDYNEVVIYTGLLSSDNQKLFFKKIIKIIGENKIYLSLEDLNLITTIDYQTSEYAKEIDGIGLDFTLSVILKVINDLKNQISTSRTSIFDLVANQIKNPKDLLVIDGFFEKCSGKTIIEENGFEELEEGNSRILYKTTKKENFRPRFSTFCDGRKAVIKGTSEPVLCNKSSLEFWWCENSQCYDVCRKKHTPLQWKNYTLEDILQILKISYDEVQYEILLNVINRVNRFLKHLSCRECNSILKPKGKSNYTFYGVSMFSCQNQECQEHSKDIYLSHCLNGQCEDIIDSRDSVKCKTHGHADECGWYICKNCNACCSSEKLKARKSNLERLSQEYKCHIEGHRDRGVICCSDCGQEMKAPVASVEIYDKQLEWFIQHKDNHPNIFRSGQRKNDNKWWFIWARGNFSYEEYRKQIQGLFSSGFSIPDFNNKEKDNQLVAEPFDEKRLAVDKVFVCPDCDHHLDLNNNEEFDYARKKAIQKFHIKIFPQTDN
jgi:hypothetical protein